VLGASQCYRSLGDQVAAQSDWCAEQSCQSAAAPGHSMHGWGLAVDVAVDGRTIGFDSPAFRWLVERGPDFGFYHPSWADAAGSAPEPWHFEYQGSLA
jgi:LAS superfamily LD-carboxypeptidase LdcB